MNIIEASATVLQALDGCRKQGALTGLDFDNLGRLALATQILKATMRLDDKFVPLPEEPAPEAELDPATKTEETPEEAKVE